MNEAIESMDTFNELNQPPTVIGQSADNSTKLSNECIINGIRGRRITRAEAIHLANEIARRANEAHQAALEAEAKLWSDWESSS